VLLRKFEDVLEDTLRVPVEQNNIEKQQTTGGQRHRHGRNCQPLEHHHVVRPTSCEECRKY